MAAQAAMLPALESEALRAFMESSPNEHQATREVVEEARETNATNTRTIN
jgi:hypothetical protein